MSNVRNTPTVLEFMFNRDALSRSELRDFQDNHEENFHGDSGSDLCGIEVSFCEDLEGLTIMELEEFFDTYCESEFDR